MSGIVALFDRGGERVDPTLLQTMLRRIDHRGPDGSGVCFDRCVGVGHQQNATTPESKLEQQPVDDANSLLTADVRIDNRPELLQELPTEDDAGPFADSELVLRAYRTWGCDCVRHLVGDFAFVIWDATRERVFCARDRMGIKPFYYHLDDSIFAVSSEMKALLSLDFVSNRIDDLWVCDYLTSMFNDTERTFYERIKRLPPAHSLTVTSEGCSIDRYWSLDPTREVVLESDRAYEREFRRLLDTAVACRLRTNDRIGLHLSGGLDSGSIAVVADRLTSAGDEIHTFSGVFEDHPDCDEREYIDAIVEQTGVTSHLVPVEDYGPLTDLHRRRQYVEAPFDSAMQYMTWLNCEKASEHGVSVLLGGNNGDNAVGYGFLGWLGELARTGRLYRFATEIRPLAESFGIPVRWVIRRYVFPMFVPYFIERGYRRVLGKPTGFRRANSLIDETFADEVGLADRYDRLRTELPMRARTERRIQYESVTSGAMTFFFEMNDLVHAAHGVEPRYPFTDTRLIEFALAIPPSQKLQNGYTRSILRRAVSEELPSAVRCRPWKTDLTEAFVDSLVEFESGRIRNMTESPGELAKYIDIDALTTSVDRLLNRHDPTVAKELWRALTLERWLNDDAVGSP